MKFYAQRKQYLIYSFTPYLSLLILIPLVSENWLWQLPVILFFIFTLTNLHYLCVLRKNPLIEATKYKIIIQTGWQTKQIILYRHIISLRKQFYFLSWNLSHLYGEIQFPLLLLSKADRAKLINIIDQYVSIEP